MRGKMQVVRKNTRRLLGLLLSVIMAFSLIDPALAYEFSKTEEGVYEDRSVGLFVSDNIGFDDDGVPLWNQAGKLLDGDGAAPITVDPWEKWADLTNEPYIIYAENRATEGAEAVPAEAGNLTLYSAVRDGDVYTLGPKITDEEIIGPFTYEKEGASQETELISLDFKEIGDYCLFYKDETNIANGIIIHVQYPMLGAYQGDTYASGYGSYYETKDDDKAVFYLIARADAELEYGRRSWENDTEKAFAPFDDPTIPGVREEELEDCVKVTPVTGKEGVFKVEVDLSQTEDYELHMAFDARDKENEDERGNKISMDVTVEKPYPKTGLFATAWIEGDGKDMHFGSDANGSATPNCDPIVEVSIRDGNLLYATYVTKETEQPSLEKPAAPEDLKLYRLVGNTREEASDYTEIKWVSHGDYTSDKFLEITYKRAGMYELVYAGADKLAEDNRGIKIEVRNDSRLGCYAGASADSDYIGENDRLACSVTEAEKTFYIITTGPTEGDDRYRYEFGTAKWKNDEIVGFVPAANQLPVVNDPGLRNRVKVEAVSGKTGVYKVTVSMDYGDELAFWFDARITHTYKDENKEEQEETEYESCCAVIAREELDDDGLKATEIGYLPNENDDWWYPVRGFEGEIIKDEFGRELLYPYVGEKLITDEELAKRKKTDEDGNITEYDMSGFRLFEPSARTIYARLPIVELYVEYGGETLTCDDLEVYGPSGQKLTYEHVLEPCSYGRYQDLDGDHRPDLDEDGDEIYNGGTNENLVCVALKQVGSYELYRKGGKEKGERPLRIQVDVPALGVYAGDTITSDYALDVDYDVENGKAEFYVITGSKESTYEFGTMPTYEIGIDADEAHPAGAFNFEKWKKFDDDMPNVQNAKGRTATVEKVSGKDGVYKITVTNMKYGKSCMFAFLALLDKEAHDMTDPDDYPEVAEAYITVRWGELEVAKPTGSFATKETNIAISPGEEDSDMADVIPDLDEEMTDILYHDKGSKLVVDLSVDEIEPEELAKKEQAALTEEEKALEAGIKAIESEAKASDTKAAGDLNFLNLSMNMTAVPSKENTSQQKKTQKITRMAENEDLLVSFALPESYRKVSRPSTNADKKDNLVYWVYRYHVDAAGKTEVERLPAKVEAGTLSFRTDRFSTYAVEVSENVPASITVKTAPTKLSYVEGESFDPAGMTLELVYLDGSTEEITSGFTCDKTAALQTTDKKVIVTYHGLTAELAITVGAKTVQDNPQTGTEPTAAPAPTTAPAPTAAPVGTAVKPADAKQDGSFKVTDPGKADASGVVKDAEVSVGKPAQSKASVTIPATIKGENGIEYKVTSIESNAFKNDKKLTTLKVGSNIETIGKSAFQGCKKLKTVTLGSKVTSIGQNSFSGCVKLKKVSVPKSVTTIGKGAFSGCKALKTVTITSTKLKKIDKNAFKGLPKNATVQVPKAKKKAYTTMLKKAGFKGKIKAK